MSVKIPGSTEGLGGIQSGAGVGGASPSSSDPGDASAFQRMVSQAFTQNGGGGNTIAPPPASPGNGTLGDRILSGLQGVSSTMVKKHDDVGYALRNAVNQGDPTAIDAALEKQSEFSLETMLLNKLVSRSTQTIDQLLKQQ